ncbi:ecdysteroid kinase domain-containing protein [Phthorimaea operculella]|nr:ecdysteroid kinase domain-containing protein [Phthorimaea operculella]
MVGLQETMDSTSVLTDARLKVILERALGKTWKAEEVSIRPAANGLTGFLGDHYRATVIAKETPTGRKETLRLFIKCLPQVNKDKAEFIDANNFNRREKTMFQLFEVLGGDEGPNAWRPKGYLYDDTILVMPDLSADGFAPRHFQDTLCLSDVLLVTASVARFHAAYANYETKKTVDPFKPYNFLDEYGDIMQEPTLCDSLWLRAAAKLSANIINTFSAKYQGTVIS